MAKEKIGDSDVARVTSINPEAKVEFVQQKANRFCFIVTKNKQRTLAGDLYACELKNKPDQIYH